MYLPCLSDATYLRFCLMLCVGCDVSRFNDFMTDCPDGLLRKEVSCLVDARISECIHFTIEYIDVSALRFFIFFDIVWQQEDVQFVKKLAQIIFKKLAEIIPRGSFLGSMTQSGAAARKKTN